MRWVLSVSQQHAGIIRDTVSPSWSLVEAVSEAVFLWSRRGLTRGLDSVIYLTWPPPWQHSGERRCSVQQRDQGKASLLGILPKMGCRNIYAGLLYYSTRFSTTIIPLWDAVRPLWDAVRVACRRPAEGWGNRVQDLAILPTTTGDTSVYNT